MRNHNYRLIFCAFTLIFLLASCTDSRKVEHKTPPCDYIADTTAFKLVPRTNSRIAVINRVPIIDFDLDYTFVSACGGKDKAIAKFKDMFAEVQSIYAQNGIKIALGQIKAFESEQSDYFHGNATETLAMLNACQLNNPIYPGNHKGYIHKGGGGGMSKTISNNYYFACSIPTTFAHGAWSQSIECLIHELGHQFGLPHTHELYHPVFDPLTGKTFTSQAYDYFGTSLGYNNGALESRNYKPVPLNTPWMYPDSCLVMSYGHIDYKHNPRKTYSFTDWEIALMKQTINSRTDVGTDGVSICKNDVANFTYDGTAHWTGLFNGSWDICYGLTVPGNTKFNDWAKVEAQQGYTTVYPGNWIAYKYTNGSSGTSLFTGTTTATINDGLRFESQVPIQLDDYSTLIEVTTLPVGTPYASSVWLNGVTKGKTIYGVVGAGGYITISLKDYGSGLTVNRFHIRGDKYAGSLTYKVDAVSLIPKVATSGITGNYTFPKYPVGTKLTVKLRPTCNDPQVGKENIYYITTK